MGDGPLQTDCTPCATPSGLDARARRFMFSQSFKSTDSLSLSTVPKGGHHHYQPQFTGVQGPGRQVGARSRTVGKRTMTSVQIAGPWTLSLTRPTLSIWDKTDQREQHRQRRVKSQSHGPRRVKRAGSTRLQSAPPARPPRYGSCDVICLVRSLWTDSRQQGTPRNPSGRSVPGWGFSTPRL